jgi:hypothetical protein
MKQMTAVILCLISTLFLGCQKEQSTLHFMMVGSGVNAHTASINNAPITLSDAYSVNNARDVSIEVDWDKWAALSDTNKQGYYILVARKPELWGSDNKGQFYLMSYNKAENKLFYAGGMRDGYAVPINIEVAAQHLPQEELDYSVSGFSALSTADSYFVAIKNKSQEAQKIHYFQIDKNTFNVNYSGAIPIDEAYGVDADYQPDWSRWAVSYDSDLKQYRLYVVSFNRYSRNSKLNVYKLDDTTSGNFMYSHAESYFLKGNSIDLSQKHIKSFAAIYSLNKQAFFVKRYDPQLPQSNESIITTDEITLIVDLSRGGAIKHISSTTQLASRNLVNIYDEGRYIQQSYYAGQDASRINEGQSGDWSPWPWNPIQVGDYAANRAEILEYREENNALYVKCIPMQWDMNNREADAIMEQWINIEGPVIKVRNKLTIHNISDVYGAPTPRAQEVPAVYPVSSLDALYAYTGDAPFTKGSLTQLPVVNLESGFWGIYDGQSGRKSITEKWMAFVNTENKFGIGVYTPSAERFLAGMAGQPGHWSTEPSTSYIAPVKTETLKEGDVYEYTYYLIIGTLDEIRSEIYKIKN